MCRTLAGIFILITPIAALAQVRGEVESVGFQNLYRPDCWTPITIRLIPETGKTDFYQIQIKQEDLDRDRVIFSRLVSVTGNAEGQGAREQRFRAYFIPQPTGGGLPNIRDDPTATIKDLEQTLIVDLCAENGKVIARLPVTNTIQNVDPRPGPWDTRRGVKFILAVTEGNAQPVYLDRTMASGIIGVMEDVIFVAVRPDELPENVLGYDAIDAIVWFDADPNTLRGGGEDKRRALDAYVQRGGKLVICQHPEWQKTLEFGELLPVDVQGIEEKRQLEPLRALARPKASNTAVPEMTDEDPWARVRGPFRVARAVPKRGAVVDEWIEWDDVTKGRSPYIARHRVGLGSVTWVAQFLGDPSITSRARRGWPYVWERVFDWKNEPVVLGERLEARDVAGGRYMPGTPMDVGHGLRKAVELDSKTAWLVTLAIVFFIAYWLVAGPGVFAYLIGRRRTHLSWFMFALSALVATGLTVLLVKLVLRGPPEGRHFSLVRVAPDGPAVVHSRLGLYIPRDGYQEIELKDTAPNSVTTITALAEHPASMVPGSRDKQGPEYVISVVDAAANEPANVSIPYRSTLKKFQATWVGEVTGKVEGSARLVEQGFIEGQITNGTGRTLQNVYICFAYPGSTSVAGDYLLFIPSWADGVTLDLNREFNRGGEEGRTTPAVGMGDAVPERGIKVRGRLDQAWMPHWESRLRVRMMETSFDDWNETVRRSLPMLSLFDRLPPIRNQQGKSDRTELLRRRARELDVSHALAAGALVVLAEAQGPLPFPLEVEGERVTGTGTTLYQFLLPLDRGRLEAGRDVDGNEEDAGTENTENSETAENAENVR